MTAHDTKAIGFREMVDPLFRRYKQADFKKKYGPSTWYQRRDGLPIQGGIS